MIKNILLWDGEWECTQQITDNLKKQEKGGKIKSLCLVREGQASFRTEEPADWIPRGLSELFSEKVIEHEWAGADGCGSALWQDGRESRYTVSYGSPEWDALAKSVEERTLACETLRDFREKIDACWQAHVKNWRELTLEQFDEHAAAIAAMQLCYKKLKALSWHRRGSHPKRRRGGFCHDCFHDWCSPKSRCPLPGGAYPQLLHLHALRRGADILQPHL